MSDSNDIPALSEPSVPAVTDDGMRAAAPDCSVSVAAPPVRRRSTWTLSMGFGVGGWLLIAGTIVLGVYNTLTAANEDEAVLREYGFGVAIALMLLLLFVINVVGALIGFIDLLRYRTCREVMQSCLALLLNLLPWVIVGAFVWLA